MARTKNSVERVKTDLDIDEDIPMQETAWKVQRVGVAVIFLIVLFAALGLFGNGLISRKIIRQSNAEIRYERFFRHEAEMELKISLNNVANDAIISIPNKYLDNFRIQSIFPEPRENKVMSDHVEYIFEGTDHMNIVFYLAPVKMGMVNGILKVNGEDYRLKHFIYP